MTQADVRLNELEPGESGTIVEVLGEDELAARLMEMGLIEGASISVIGRAPMGDPTEYSVCGYRISLRRIESMRIMIQRDAG